MRNALKILSLAVLVTVFGVTAQADWENGVAAFKSGQYPQASQQFRTVVEATPDFAGGHFMLGQSLMKEGKKQEALTHLRKAYELESGNVNHAFALATGYFENGRYNETVQMLGKINKGSLPGAQQGIYDQMKAASLAKSGRADEALSALRDVARSKPNDANAWYNYGTSAYAAEEFDEAVTALAKASQLGSDAKMKETYVKALMAQARRQDGAAKRSTYAKAVSTAQSLAASGSYEHQLVLGEALLGAGKYSEAVTALDKARAKNANDFYAHYYSSQAYTSLQQWDRAESSARQALKVAKDDRSKKRAYRQIGFVNEKMKNYGDAKDAYRNAGDQAGIRRIEENERIAAENKDIEAHNQTVEEARRLEEQLRDLEENPPRF
jgi:tetratricopeptide (TPR) repeat protein